MHYLTLGISLPVLSIETAATARHFVQSILFPVIRQLYPVFIAYMHEPAEMKMFLTKRMMVL